MVPIAVAKRIQKILDRETNIFNYMLERIFKCNL
jgi:hypothetical protein